MASDCDPLIDDPFVFPRRPSNRPALDRIAYRIGEYPDMVAAMIRHIDGEVALSGWTHRGVDDPGIALLQGAAIVGDILTFYQDRYANEAFLRTAEWRESVAALVRLTGYRLTAGLGGHATLAIEVKGDRPITIPAGFPFKTDLEGSDVSADFQTDSDLLAHPHLSKFNLYRPRSYATTISAGVTTVEVDRAGGSSALAAIAALDLQPGDKILLMPDAPPWRSSSTASFTDQDSSQILKVKEVETVHDRTLVTFETTVARGWSLPLRAYRLGRTFRHFGHAAPTTYTQSIKGAGDEITGTREKPTLFVRHTRDGHACANTSSSIDLPGRMIPLDQEVTDLMVGGRIAIETRAMRDGTDKPFVQVRTISKLRSTTLGFGSLNAATTLVTMNDALVTHTVNVGDEADIRDYRVHEITSPEIRFRPKAGASGGGFGSGTDALAFFGRRNEVRKLADRPLTMQHDDGRVTELTCINEIGDFGGSPTDPRMWLLSFDAPPAPFLRADFDEVTPNVTVFANTVTGSQGKAVPMIALGNGDARAVFQTFKLPKPVTHLLSPGADPAEVPELTVYVNSRAVERVSAFYGQPGDALVYILRRDDEGAFHIQFGDGKTGARLPSGTGNVTATLRTGSGARGMLPDGVLPSAGSKIDGLGKLHIPAGVSGGADPEQAGNAKLAAPGRVQGLGRIVSLADYETELLSIPGVSRVRAAWDMSDGVPGVVLRTLLESGREAEFSDVRDAIYKFQRCRGSNRFVISVEQARLRQVYLDLRYAFDPSLIEADIAASVTRALAPMDAVDTDAAGVFALRQRQIGEPEYASRIEGRVQALDGVTWARVTGLGKLSVTPVGDLPEDLWLPPAPRTRHARITAGAGELFQLHSAHLSLVSAPPEPGEDCA